MKLTERQKRGLADRFINADKQKKVAQEAAGAVKKDLVAAAKMDRNESKHVDFQSSGNEFVQVQFPEKVVWDEKKLKEFFQDGKMKKFINRTVKFTVVNLADAPDDRRKKLEKASSVKNDSPKVSVLTKKKE